MLSITEIARRRSAALLRRFRDDRATPPSAVDDVERVSRLSPFIGSHARPLPGHETVAFLWVWPDADDSSVWVRGGASHHRYQSAFWEFIALTYGEVDLSDRGRFHVDHLRARATVPEDFFIRLELVHGPINSQHGAAFEKKDKSSTITVSNREGGKDMYGTTFIMALKPAGLAAPRNSGDTERIDRIRSFFTGQGWDERDVDNAVTALLRKSTWQG